MKLTAGSVLSVLLLLLVHTRAAPLSPRQANGEGCADVKIIVARGSTEPQGEGFTGAIANLVKNGPCAKNKSINSTALVYPAQLVPYTPSINEGILNLKKLLQSEVRNCPKQDLVLMGWSQGAHAIGSVLAGEDKFSNAVLGTVGLFTGKGEVKTPKVPEGGFVEMARQMGFTPPSVVSQNVEIEGEIEGKEEEEKEVDDEEEEGEEYDVTEEGRRLLRRQSKGLIKELDKKVKAVIFLGDPTRLAGEPFNLGTNSDVNGIFPRTKGQLSQFADRIQSYCDSQDTFCQAGGLLLPVHFAYFVKYDAVSAAFVNEKVCGEK